MSACPMRSKPSPKAAVPAPFSHPSILPACNGVTHEAASPPPSLPRLCLSADKRLGPKHNRCRQGGRQVVRARPGADPAAVVFDAISDPVMGSISDRWHSRLGRRHPFLYLSALPLGFCFFAVYSPPEGLEQIGLFLWFTVFTIGLRISLTFYHVPHLALGAELSDDYKERSVIYGYNSIFMMVGGSLAFFAAWTWLGRAEGGIAEAANFLTTSRGKCQRSALRWWHRAVR